MSCHRRSSIDTEKDYKRPIFLTRLIHHSFFWGGGGEDTMTLIFKKRLAKKEWQNEHNLLIFSEMKGYSGKGDERGEMRSNAFDINKLCYIQDKA